MKKLSCAVALALLAVPAVAATHDEIKSLLEAKQYQQAYALGSEHPDQLGQPIFDFYFGIAAIDSGVPGEGVLALERYLAKYPENRSARFHLARGYYVLGEDLMARTLFNELLAGADAEQRDAIHKFVDAIRSRESRYTPTAAFFIEYGLGHDDNINGGVDAGQVKGLPSGFMVGSGASQARERDFFQTLNTGAQGTLPIAPGVALYGGVQAGGRWHAGSLNDVFDQTNVAAQAGVSVLNARNLYRLGVERGQMFVDNQEYLNLTSLVGEWAHQLDQFNRLNLAGQWSELRYEDSTVFLDKQKTLPANSAASQRDSNLYMMTAGWTRALVTKYSPVFTLAANFGQERSARGRPDFSRDIMGLRAGVTLQPFPKWSAAFNLTYQDSRYESIFPLGTEKRQDQYYGTEFSVAYAVDRNWSVRGDYTYAKQQSNIGFYDYDRQVVSAKVRYDFK